MEPFSGIDVIWLFLDASILNALSEEHEISLRSLRPPTVSGVGGVAAMKPN